MNNFITEDIGGVEIKFKTTPGVFSKDGLDNGTRLLLASDFKLEDRSLAADLGTGSGVIGIYLAKKNSRAHIHMLDVNLRTVNLARENVELNDLHNAEVFLSDQFSGVKDRTYHLILSNPAQHFGNEFLKECAKECFSHLKPDGEVYWVVQKMLHSVVERFFQEIFGNFQLVDKGGDYIIIKGVKHGKA